MRQYRLLERQHPIFSPLALISTIILICGLAGWVTVAGGQAFSPGGLSAVNHDSEPLGEVLTHAEFETDCNQCHAPFKGIEAQRCERCHTNIAQQLQTGQGIHSRFENVTRCGDCHQEHKGRSFDQFAAALVDFDHGLTDFSLEKHVFDYQDSRMACTTCHQHTGRKFTLMASACADCHQTAAADFMTAHTAAYGRQCLDCHDGHDTIAAFTLAAHAEVFELTGVHASTACEKCHNDGQFKGIASECVACHAEPAAHAQMFGTDCIACHTPAGWLPATLEAVPFDHARDTGFSLVTHSTNFDGAAFTCRTCHPGSQPVSFNESLCVDCHRSAGAEFMAGHIAQFGQNCLDCHHGTGEMANFDHNQVWPLDGQHAALACDSCHINKIYQGTPTDCVGCHAEPAIHAGLFGTTCNNCHTSQGWQPARLTQHTFPLDHGEQGEIECATCHPATYTEYTCYNCHEHGPANTEREHREEGITPPQLLACAQCHPTGQEAVN